MKLDHEVVLAAPLDRVWQAMLDTGRVAHHRGALQVADVTYTGSVRLLDADADDHVATFQARAGEDGGPGTARAIVRHRLERAADGTKVTVDAELALTGRAASLDRERVEADAGRILDGALERLVAKPADPAPPPAPESPARQRRHVRAAAIAAVALVAVVVLRRVRFRR